MSNIIKIEAKKLTFYENSPFWQKLLEKLLRNYVLYLTVRFLPYRNLALETMSRKNFYKKLSLYLKS
jgi:hypothetical protein